MLSKKRKKGMGKGNVGCWGYERAWKTVIHEISVLSTVELHGIKKNISNKIN